MEIYEVLKDCMIAAKQAENIPLFEKIIETQVQILDLINENENLKRENRELKDKKIKLDNVERHSDAYITLKDDTEKIIYCSCCFDKDGKLVQAQIDEWGRYICPACKYIGYYDKEKYNRKWRRDN